MRDESYWYGPQGWPLLRSRLVRLCIVHSDELLRMIAGDADDLNGPIRCYVERVARAVDARIDPAKPSMWEYAMPLLGDIDGLKRRLLSDRTVLRQGRRGDHDERVWQKQALGQIIHRYIDTARQGINSNRQNVWERINRISLEIHAASASEGSASRCTPDHFRALLEQILRVYPRDHNLPRTVATLEGYFLEFCPDCRSGPPIDPDDVAAIVYDTGIDPALDRCLEQLAKHDKALFAVVMTQFRFRVAAYANMAAYARAEGISRHQCRSRLQNALALLRRCIEKQVKP